MTFSQKVKTEILENRLSKPKFTSLVQGLIFSACRFDNDDYYEIRINKKIIIDKLKSTFKNFKFEFFDSKANINWICIKKKSIKINKNPQNIQYFFAGLFIGGGSISKFESKSYHLEISFLNEEKCAKVLSLLQQNQTQFTFRKIFHNKRFNIYLKKITQIIYFLMAIGALEQAAQLEVLRIKRDHFLNANRITNFDIYNAKKITRSSSAFAENWKLVQKKQLTNHFTDEQQFFFRLRAKNPELSIREISEILKKEYNLLVSKGGLNHWLVKLKKILEKGGENAK
ncbi:DNA-binding protein WhiA [Mycoplasma sp. 'Moose RK']|uniref:DNA-binding protein WhiA n=1 Tax=Mycoplasma sp. 'Moose RK' TaxID=2780095 RepID=UPI0018C26174|nr:DNA-binding protein WhiA [Mycoplasma sp. 'Moose RK']MBG0730559.1 DNA-binding protein WhiA [Mycoplasma sp. 'Moose RK']